MLELRTRFRMRIVLDPNAAGITWPEVLRPYIGDRLPGSMSNNWHIPGAEPMRWINWDPDIGKLWCDELTDGPLFDGLDSGLGIVHLVLAEWPMSIQAPPQAVYSANGDPWARITHDYDPKGNPVCRCEIVASSYATAVYWYEAMCSGEPPVRPARWSVKSSGYEQLMLPEPVYGDPADYPWFIDDGYAGECPEE